MSVCAAALVVALNGAVTTRKHQMAPWSSDRTLRERTVEIEMVPPLLSLAWSGILMHARPNTAPSAIGSKSMRWLVPQKANIGQQPTGMTKQAPIMVPSHRYYSGAHRWFLSQWPNIRQRRVPSPNLHPVGFMVVLSSNLSSW